MSGTSLDGIDVAIVDVDRRRLHVVAHSTTPYPDAIREGILAISNSNTHTSDIAHMNFQLAELYAKAVRRCGVPLESLELVGCHGQTIYHDRQCTLQIGDGSVLAERLGVPVVSDFRPRDMAAGGHGAPLVPFVDYRLYRHAQIGRIALNIGGIANITVLPPDASHEEVTAFDTGPGNMVIDQLVSIYTRGERSYDHNGDLAAKGKIRRELIKATLMQRFYRQPPPKTVGREQYGREFVDEWLRTDLPIIDLIATATAFTAATVAVAIDRFVEVPVQEVVASGGGVRNRQLMGYLAAFLPNLSIRTSYEFGIDSDAKEAIAFAILAYETWHGRPSNVPAATGAKRAVVLGKISL